MHISCHNAVGIVAISNFDGWHFFFTDRKRFSQTYLIFAQNAVGIVSMAKLNLFFPFRWEIHFAQTYLISNQILEMIKITTCVLFWGDHHIQCCLLRYILPCLWFILKSFDLLKHQIIAAGELHPVWGPGLGAIGLVLDALPWRVSRQHTPLCPSRCHLSLLRHSFRHCALPLLKVRISIMFF